MLWFWAALVAAILWGISYAVADQTLKAGISASTQLALMGLALTPFYTAWSYYHGNLQKGIVILRANPKMLLYFAVIVLCYAGANMLSFWSIKEKNATLSSMIEIAYPFFTALFAWLIFGQNQLTINSLIGGLMIFGGIAFIYVGK